MVIMGISISDEKIDRGAKMKKTKSMTVVICMSFLTTLSLAGLVTIVHGEEGKTTIKQEYSEEKDRI